MSRSASGETISCLVTSGLRPRGESLERERDMNQGAAEELVAALAALASQQNLRSQAVEGCDKWLRAGAEEGADGLGGWAAEEIVPRFASCSLVFEHGILDYPFIETRLELYVQDDSGVCFRDLRPIGYYRLITLLDGTADDDYFVIETSKSAGD